MAEASDEIAAYEAWLRQYVKLAEAGRKLAAELQASARRRASKIDEHRFSSHAQRLYNEEVYWTLQMKGVAALAAERHAARPAAPERAKAKARAAAPARKAKGVRAR